MSKIKKTLSDYRNERKAAYEDQIRRWKHDHGTVKAFFIDAEQDTKVIFFRQPSRQQLASAENLATSDDGRVDFHKKAERHIVDCHLGGDLTVEQILADTSVYLPASKFVLINLIEEKKSGWEDC